MASAESNSGLDHPSFVAAAGTVAAYGLVLLAMTVLLFGVPYLLFTFL
jgi:hypothetical protein